MKGVFYNEMYVLELDKGRWYQQFLRCSQLFSCCLNTVVLWLYNIACLQWYLQIFTTDIAVHFWMCVINISINKQSVWCRKKCEYLKFLTESNCYLLFDLIRNQYNYLKFSSTYRHQWLITLYDIYTRKGLCLSKKMWLSAVGMHR